MHDDVADSNTEGSQVECPTCGRTDFSSERGMKIHHNKSHGESLRRAKTELTCEWCDEEFIFRSDRADQRRFCSEDCMNEWKAESGLHTGEDNPAWSGGKETTYCEQCGDKMEVYPSKSREYCSTECMAEGLSEVNGEEHPNWNRVTVECGFCGDEYNVPPFRADTTRFCSHECRNAHFSEKGGSDHRWWEGGPVTLECEWCSDVFQVRQNVAEERRFCSVECMGEWRSTLTGEEHPLYEGGKTTLSCEQCGDAFEVWPAKADERRFCSDECMGEWYSEHQSGQDHPGWRGGKSVYDAVKKLLSDRPWEVISREHRQRESACQLCGSDEGLQTHHTVPVMSGGTNDPWNRMTLCASCHGKVESFTRKYAPPVLIDDED